MVYPLSDPDSSSLRGPVDMHVHLVGNGLRGSGCRLHLQGLHRHLANFMLRQIGLRVSWDHPDFDEAYVELLRGWIRNSSLTHVVLLAHEEVYSEDGQRLDFGSMHVPDSAVLGLSQCCPEFLAGVSIHPARSDALDALDEALARGAVLLKLLPNCQNVDCSRPAYRRFWERMAAAGLPLLTHTGGEHTVPQYQPEFANPQYLEGPLACGVTVIAAHAATRSGLTDPDYLPVLLRMMERWPHLYADLSALNLPVRSAGLASLLQSNFQDRLVHGSDFPVPVQPTWAALRNLLPVSTARWLTDLPNVLERDYQSKLAMGFSPELFTRIWDLLRLTPPLSTL